VYLVNSCVPPLVRVCALAGDTRNGGGGAQAQWFAGFSALVGWPFVGSPWSMCCRRERGRVCSRGPDCLSRAEPAWDPRQITMVLYVGYMQ
jgi:hypothetical protein